MPHLQTLQTHWRQEQTLTKNPHIKITTYKNLTQTTPETTITQTQNPCAKDEKAISTFTNGKINRKDYESLNNAKKLEFVTPEQMKALQHLKEDCRGKPTTTTTPKQQTIGTIPTTEQPKSCEDTCKTKTLTSKKPDWNSHILAFSTHKHNARNQQKYHMAQQQLAENALAIQPKHQASPSDKNRLSAQELLVAMSRVEAAQHAAAEQDAP